MANKKKYVSDITLSNLVAKIKELFVKKTDFNTELAKKANSSHTHSIADTTNLQNTLDGKVPTSRTINNKPLSANITLSASDVGAAASTHDHNSVYYTQSQVDTKLSGKSDTTHNHDTKYEAKNTVSTHNTSTSAHNDIRDLITGLTTRLNTLANSDDTTLDQMSEVVAYIKNNKSLIGGITTNKVNVSDIVNNLTTNVSNKPLSAAQGVVLKNLIDALQLSLDAIPQSDWSQSDSTQLDYIKNRTHWSENKIGTIVDTIATLNSTKGEYNTGIYYDIEIGESYTITYDENIYECVAFNDAGFATIGSTYQSYTNYPFCIFNNSDGAIIICTSTTGSHTVKVAGTEIVHPLDEKFIPSLITIDDIDAICGQTILVATENGVTF